MTTSLTAPVLRVTDWGLLPNCLQYDPRHNLLYVGCISTDPWRRNLAVIPVESDRTTLGRPSWFSTRPILSQVIDNATLSAVACMALSDKCLYLGIHANSSNTLPALVVFELDRSSGLPHGPAHCFDIKVKNDRITQCWALALHPNKDILYIAGDGGAAIAPVDPNTGLPADPRNPSQPWPPFLANAGCTSISINSDGDLLCLGMTGWTIDIMQLDTGGLTGHSIWSGSVLRDDDIHDLFANAFAFPNLQPQTQSFAVATIVGSTVYYMTPATRNLNAVNGAWIASGKLRYFPVPATSLQRAHPLDVTIPGDVQAMPLDVQAMPLAITDPMRLIVVADHHYIDAYSDSTKPIVRRDGAYAVELALAADGSPAGVSRFGPPALNQRAYIVGSREPAIAVIPPHGVLTHTPFDAGSRVKGLVLRMTVERDPPLASTDSLKVNGDVIPYPAQPPIEVDLDRYLKNRDDLVGLGIWPRVDASGNPQHVSSARLRIEIVQGRGSAATVLHGTLIDVIGPWAVLYLPGYGELADLSDLPKMITTSAGTQLERYAWAGAAASDANKAPLVIQDWQATSSSSMSAVQPITRTVVTSPVTLADMSAEALEIAPFTLRCLGCNTIEISPLLYIGSDDPQQQLSSYSSLTPFMLHAAGIRAGFQQFAMSIFFPAEGGRSWLVNNENKDISGPVIDQIINDVARGLKKNGILDFRGNLQSEGRFALLIWTDEQSSVYDAIPDNNAPLPTGFLTELLVLNTSSDALTMFRHYLQGVVPQNSSVEDYFGQSCKELSPPPVSELLNTKPNVQIRRRFYWTVRFVWKSYADAEAALLAKLAEKFGSELLVALYPARQGTPHRAWMGSYGPLDNPPTVTGTHWDQAPDLFEIGRSVQAAITRGTRDAMATQCLFLEIDWTDVATQVTSFDADLLRSAARYPGVKFGALHHGYGFGTLRDGFPDGGVYKIMALAGRGAAALNLYQFGNPYSGRGQDDWCDREITYKVIARGLKFLGDVERAFQAAGSSPARHVALLYPKASQLWLDYDPTTKISGSLSKGAARVTRCTNSCTIFSRFRRRCQSREQGSDFPV